MLCLLVLSKTVLEALAKTEEAVTALKETALTNSRQSLLLRGIEPEQKIINTLDEASSFAE